jgi:chromosome segregation ATPase
MAEVIRLESKMIGPDYCTMSSRKIVAAEASDLESVETASRKRDDILSKGLATLVDSSSRGLAKCEAEIAGLVEQDTKHGVRIGLIEAKAAELVKSYSDTGPILHSLQSSMEEHCARVNAHVTLVTKACDEQRSAFAGDIRNSMDVLARAEQLRTQAAALVETSRTAIDHNVARIAEVTAQVDSSFERSVQLRGDFERLQADFEEHKRRMEETAADARRAVTALEQLSTTMLDRADAFAHFASRCRWDTLWGRLKWTVLGASLPSVPPARAPRARSAREPR